MSGEFEGRVALVTGAGKGLGRAYAHWLAARGCAVVVNNRVRAGVAPSAGVVVEEIVAAGGKAVADEHSVEDEAGARAMVAAAVEAFGRLDILICNAGVATRFDFAEATIEELHRVVDVNLWGTIYPLHAAWKHFLKQGYGRAVLTGSSVGLYGHPASAIYGATKSAMSGLARSLAHDVPEDADIRVNVIAPFAYTPMSSDQMDEAHAGFLSPDRVAPVAGWLASEECQESGMIFHAGAGRAARGRLIESVSVRIPEDGLGSVFPQFETLQTAPEPRSASESGNRVASG